MKKSFKSFSRSNFEHPELERTRASSPSHTKKKKLRFWLTLIVGVILFVGLLSQLRLEQLIQIIHRANPWYLLSALACALTATAVRAIRYKIFFPAPGRGIELYGVFGVVRVLNVLMPFRTGEFANLAMLKSRGFCPSIAETAPVWFILRISDIGALCIVVLLSTLPFIGQSKKFINVYEYLNWKLLLLLIGMLSILVGLLVLARYFYSTNTYSSWLHSRSRWLRSRFNAIGDGLTRVRQSTKLFKMLCLAVVIWLLMIAVLVLVQKGLGSSLSFRICSRLSALSLLSSILPIHAPLNIGTGDLIWTGLMMMHGIDREEAVALAMGIRANLLIMLFIDGIIGYVITLNYLGISKYSKYNSIEEENL